MAGQMSNAPEVRRADQSMSHDATLKSLQEGYSPRSPAVVHANAKNRPRPLWVLVVRCAHEVAGGDQQERMPAVAYRYTFGVASAHSNERTPPAGAPAHRQLS